MVNELNKWHIEMFCIVNLLKLLDKKLECTIFTLIRNNDSIVLYMECLKRNCILLDLQLTRNYVSISTIVDQFYMKSK